MLCSNEWMNGHIFFRGKNLSLKFSLCFRLASIFSAKWVLFIHPFVMLCPFVKCLFCSRRKFVFFRKNKLEKKSILRPYGRPEEGANSFNIRFVYIGELSDYALGLILPVGRQRARKPVEACLWPEGHFVQLSGEKVFSPLSANGRVCIVSGLCCRGYAGKIGERGRDTNMRKPRTYEQVFLD